MATIGCGCKICKAGEGEYANQLIKDGISPLKVLGILQGKDKNISERILKNHLAAYSIPYPETVVAELVEARPITIDLNKIDFSEYAIDIQNLDSVINYVQQISLKIFLNQTKITLQAQQDVLDGNSLNVSKEVMRNLATAYQILDKSIGINVAVNQATAIKTVEAMGLLEPHKEDAETRTNTETD